jgi:cyclomaltodextrinase
VKLKIVFIIGLLLMTSNIKSQVQKLSLDGEWLFKADSQKVGVKQKWFSEKSNRSDWQKMKVPDFWENHEHFKNYDGWGWYARTFQYKKNTNPTSIYFAGVDDDAFVWINGIEVGSHIGYSDPFSLDVTNALRDGENLIVVQVLDYGGGGGIYKPVTIIDSKFVDELKKSEFYGNPALKSAEWVKDAVIYSAYLRSASKEGTFKGFEKRIPELKEMGVTVIWLLPIHPVGIKNRKGKLGSPYAVKDYYGINPEFGTIEDFKNLLNTVHENGMKLIIDLVANHTSWDSKLIVEHPDWFTKDEKGNFVPPVADWADVADLDYSKSDLRKYMIAMMKWWVKDVGIDGFRCDVAELVPTDFWDEARDTLNTVKEVMMLSEGSLPEHHVKAFDLTYSWNVYDVLEPLLQGKRLANSLDQILENEELQFPTGSLRMRFNTNHDKNAWDAPAEKKFGPKGLKLTAVLINTMPGVPMIYTGEEVGNDKRLSLFEKTDIDWKRTSEMKELYSALFKLRNEHKAFSRGKMIRIETPIEKNVYAFLRIEGDDAILAVLNFSKKDINLHFKMPLEVASIRSKKILSEALSDTSNTDILPFKDKVEMRLRLYGYKIYILTK